MIGEKFNFDDVYFRDLTLCVLNALEGSMKWTNNFSSGDKKVEVPFYYSLSGGGNSERFLLDSFVDDIVSNNRYIELNTDSIPYGILTMNGFNAKQDEFKNPNVWLKMVVEDKKELKKVLAKVRAIPIDVNYELMITLDSEIDVFKCNQAILNNLWFYKFIYFEYNLLNIDAFISVPDSNSVEITRETNLTSTDAINLKLDFVVSTYFPAFNADRYYTDTNVIIPDNLKKGLNSSDTVEGDRNKTGVYYDKQYYNDSNITFPVKTRWYNNLMALRNDYIKRNNLE